MDNLVVEWETACRRAAEVREEIAGFAQAGEPLPPEKVIELAELEVEVLTRLQAVHRADIEAQDGNAVVPIDAEGG